MENSSKQEFWHSGLFGEFSGAWTETTTEWHKTEVRWEAVSLLTLSGRTHDE